MFFSIFANQSNKEIIKLTILIMKKALVLLSTLLFLSSYAYGKMRTQAQMDVVAKSVFSTFTKKARSIDGNPSANNLVSDALSSNSLNKKLRESFPDLDNDYFMVYTIANGYAIVSTDDRMPALIAYSDSHRFSADDMPPAMKALLALYVRQMNDIPARTPSMRKADAPMELEPLLGGINFSQGSPYNDMCPLLNGKRTATGCLATAMAQIMAYYKYPTQMLGEKIEYVTGKNKIPVSWDCTNTRFDWDNILDTYPSETIPDYTANETTTSTQYMSFQDITVSDQNKLEITDFYSTNGQTMTFDLQLLLCDNAGRFIQPTGQMKTINDLKPHYGWGAYPIVHSLPGVLADGDYRLYLGVRLAGTSEWSVVQRLNKKNQREEFYLPVTKQGMSYTLEGRTFACVHTKAQGDAIATLMAACGASTYMDYGEQSSTGYAQIGSGLIDYMGYNDGLYFLYSNAIPTRQLIEQTIEAELLEHRPIYCCGTTSEEGSHAYIIDGFQYYQGTTPYYHINWGWNGADNGFFLLDAQTTSDGANYGYYYFLGMNILPDKGQDLGFVFTVDNITVSVANNQIHISLNSIYNRMRKEFRGSLKYYVVDSQDKEYLLSSNHWNSWGSGLGYGTWDKTCDIPQDLPADEYSIVLKMHEDGSTVERNVLTPGFPTATLGSGGSAIADIPAAAPQQDDVFTLSGRKLPPTSSDNLPKGLYISKGKKYISE
jgi:hypothetical protein